LAADSREQMSLTVCPTARHKAGGEDKGVMGRAKPPNATDSPKTWMIQPPKHDSNKFVFTAKYMCFRISGVASLYNKQAVTDEITERTKRVK